MKATYSHTVERGILTSAYKQEIKSEMRHAHLNAVSDVKNAVYERCTSTAGTILQVAFFAVVLILMAA